MGFSRQEHWRGVPLPSPRFTLEIKIIYTHLENPMDRGAWWATVHGVTRVGPTLVTKPPPPHMCIHLHVHVCRYVYKEGKV